MIKKRLIAMGLTICMLFGNTNAVFANSRIQSIPAVVEETQETIETSETTAEETFENAKEISAAKISLPEEEMKETEEPVVNQENDSQEETIHNQQQTELDINNEQEAEKKTNEQITEEQQPDEQQPNEQQPEEQQSEEQQSEEQQMNETMNDLQTEPEPDEPADIQTDAFEENYAETELVNVEETIAEMQEAFGAQNNIEQNLQTNLQTVELLAEETKNKIEPAATITETVFLSDDMNAEKLVSSVTAKWNNETVTLTLGTDYTVEWKGNITPTQIGDAVIVIKPVSGSNYSFEAIERTVAVCEVVDIKTVNQTYKIAPYTADDFIASESKAKLEQYGYTASLDKEAKNPGNYTLTVKLTEDSSGKYIRLTQNGTYTVKIEKARTTKMEIKLRYDSVAYKGTYSNYDTGLWIEKVYAVFEGENGAVERKELNTSTEISMGEPKFYGSTNTKLRFSVSRPDISYYGDLDCGNFILAGGSRAYGYVDVMLYCVDISTRNIVYNGNENNALSYLDVRYESGTALPKFKYTITDENGNTVSTSKIQDYADNIINKIKVKDVGTYNIELSVYKPDDLSSPYLTRSVSVTVNPKELQVNYRDAKNVTYNGSAYEVNDFFEDTAINGVVDGEEVSLTSAALTEAGKNSLKLSLRGKDADNYILGDDTVEVEILPFEVSELNVPVKGNRRYNGTDFSASDFITNSGITVVDSAGNKLELNSNQYHICFDGMATAKNKGQYTIVVTLTDQQNFSIKNPIVKKTVSISAADAQISFNSPTKSYGAADPTEYSLITENASLLAEAQETISDLRVSYGYDGSDAGSYALKELMIGDKSAVISASEEANTEYCSIGNFRYYCKPDQITITKAKADLQVSMDHLTYKGSSFTVDSIPCSITLAGQVLTEEDYTVEFDRWQNSFDSFDGEGPVNAGDYGLKFTVTNPSVNKNFYIDEDDKNKDKIIFYSHVSIDPYNGKLKVTTKDVTYDGKTHYPEEFIEKVEIVDRTDEARVLLTLSKYMEDACYKAAFENQSGKCDVLDPADLVVTPMISGGNYTADEARDVDAKIMPLPVTFSLKEDITIRYGEPYWMNADFSWSIDNSFVIEEIVSDCLDQLAAEALVYTDSMLPGAGENAIVKANINGCDIEHERTAVKGNFAMTFDTNDKKVIVTPGNVTLNMIAKKETPVYQKDIFYAGSDFVESVTMTAGTETIVLTEGVDYVLSFADGTDAVKNAGTYSLTASLIKGSRYYESVAETDRRTSIEVNIAKAAAKIDVSGVKTKYTSNGKMQSITSGAKLNHDETYLVYSNNTFTAVEDGNGMKVMITAAETTNYLAAEASVTISVDQPKIPSGEEEKEEEKEENSSTDDKKTSDHTNQIIQTLNNTTEHAESIDLTSSVVFDAEYQPESFELQEVTIENEHQGNRLLIWTFPNENGVVEQHSLIFNAAYLADLTKTKDIEHIVFENGEAIVEWDLMELLEGNLSKLIALILNDKEEITTETLKQDCSMAEPLTITAEQFSLFQVEICIVPVETEDGESAYEVSFWLRWGDQKLNVSNLLSSVTIAITVDNLLNENNYDTFADVNTLVYQMNREEEKGQEEPESKVLESRLLIMPEEYSVTSYDSNVPFDLYRHYCLASDYAGEGIYRIMTKK